MIDTIFFDNWNTLVQAPNLMKRGSSTKIFHQYLSEKGVEVSYEDFIEIYVQITRLQERKSREDGHREPDYLKRLENVFSKLNISNPLTHASGAWQTYLNMWVDQTQYFPFVKDMLLDLKKAYKLGVITNYMDGKTCRKIFDKLGYNDIFQSLVISHELGYLKPAGILFEVSMNKTNSKPENCVMVGDTYSADVVGGNLAGMKTVLVDVYDSQQDYYHDCSVVIKNINEFPGALKKLC